MKMPRYDDVPVFGQDFLITRRQKADYSGLFRCVGFIVVLIVTFLTTVTCLLTGLYVLYPLDPPEATNILVLGVDTRANSGEGVEIGRTDSIMIVSIDPQREQISVLSIPRDLYLNVPGQGRLRANTVVRNAELNNPGSGLAIMQESIENTFSVEIHHIVRVNFEGFIEVVDALGGIEVEVPNRVVDTQFPLPDDSGTKTVIFEPGLQWMDGERALEYARTRQADSDYARASRQQKVLEAILLKLNTPRGLLRLPLVVTAIDRNVESDFRFADFIRYGPAILHYAPDGIETLVITPDYMISDGGIQLPNLEALNDWLDDHLRPAPTSSSTS